MITLSAPAQSGYKQDFETNEEMLLAAAQLGAAWGQLEAELMLEDVENGHRREPATWTTGQWCGDNPFPTDDDRCWEYDSAIDRAAQAAYEAAIQAAQAVRA